MESLDRLFSLAYEELRRLAATVRRNDPSATLTPTALVHEAWLKLAATPELAPLSPLHFRRIAARAMRQVLVDAARRRLTAKRGQGRPFLTLDPETDAAMITGADEFLALHDALGELAARSPRQAEMVELRFFGGLEVGEAAEVLGVSEATILRDWRAAKAWLGQAMRSER